MMTSLQDKKEQFRKYLEKGGVIDALTEALIKLYEETNKPANALEFIQRRFCKKCTNEETVENMKADLIAANDTIDKLERELSHLKGNLKRTPSESLKIVENGIQRLNNEESRSLVRKYLPAVMDNLQNATSQYGTTLADCLVASFEYPHDPHLAVYVGDSNCYSVFGDLLNPIIRDYHNISNDEYTQPEIYWGDPQRFNNLDPDGEYIKLTKISITRNLEGYPFVPKMTEEDFGKVMEKIKDVLECLEGEYGGTFQPLESIDLETKKELLKAHICFDKNNKLFESVGGYRFWPTGRAIYYNASRTVVVWINQEDHLQIISMSQTANIPEIYRKLIDVMPSIDSKLQYDQGQYGYGTTSPTNLGSALRASAHIILPKLSADREALEELCDNLNLEVFLPEENTNTVLEIANKQKLGITEYEALQIFHEGVFELISAESTK